MGVIGAMERIVWDVRSQMKQQITVDGVTLTRAQVEQAYAALQEPEVPEVDRSLPVTDRVTVCYDMIQIPLGRVESALRYKTAASAYMCVSNTGKVGVFPHFSSDHDLPTLTGFTSAPKETR